MNYVKQSIINKQTVIDKTLLDAMQEGIIEGIKKAEEALAKDTSGKEEVYIGETKPTDENIKVWIDPNEQPPTLTFTGAVNDSWNGTENKTINVPTIAGEPGKSITIDNIVESELDGKRSTTITFSDDSEITINDGADGADGERGTGILNTTTGIVSYTTTVNGVKPTYRILLSTLKTQANVDEVLISDTVRYSTFLYPIITLDSQYAYMGARISLQGATGGSGAAGKDGKSAYQYAVDGGYTGTEAEFAAKLAEEIPQADMAQNDETAADYIKNRTHWVENIEEVLIEEAVYPYSEEDGAIIFPEKTLVAGDTYLVRWNDVEYECVPFRVLTEEGTIIYMGNPVFVGGDDNGMPLSAVDMGGFIAFNVEEDTKIGVRHNYTKYHQIDRNFVPKQSFIIHPTEKFGNSPYVYKANGDTDELAYYLLNGLPVWIDITALEGTQQMYQVVSWNLFLTDFGELLPSGNSPYLPLQLWIVEKGSGFNAEITYCQWNATD